MGHTFSHEGKEGMVCFCTPRSMTVLVMTQAVLLVLTVLRLAGWKRIGCCPLQPHVMLHCLVVNALHQDNTVLLCFRTDKAC